MSNSLDAQIFSLRRKSAVGAATCFLFGASSMAAAFLLFASEGPNWIGLGLALSLTGAAYAIRWRTRRLFGGIWRNGIKDEHDMRLLDAINAQIAVVDPLGKIISANESWKQQSGAPVGADYLEGLGLGGAPAAQAIREGMRALLNEEIIRFSAEFPKEVDKEDRWYLLRATRLKVDGSLCLVMVHDDLTERHVIEENLKASEQKYKTTAQLTSDVLYEWRIEQDEVLSYATESLATPIPQLLRPHSRSEFKKLIHPDDRSRVIVSLDKALRTGEEFIQEFRILAQGGDYRTVVDRGRAVFDDAGRASVFYGSVQDVSEIRRAEQELLARERMLTAILQNALEAVIITDSSGAILVWNRAAEEIFGWHGDDVIGKAVADTLVSEDQRWVFSSGIRGLKRRINRRVELVGRRRDGSEFPAEVTLTAVRSNGVYFAAFVRDVSEQKRTERENARFSSLVQHSTDAIVSTDLEGVVESWNPAAVPIYGRTAEQMIGKNLSEVLQPERLKAFLRAMKLIARGETVSLFEYCRPNAKGELIWLAVSCSPMRDAAGEVVGCASIIRDVTELRRAADAIRQHEETQRANRAKSEFLSRMSHELRTPLNSVLGFAQLIEMRSPDGPHLESARHIAKAGRHLLSLINEILDISRIETGRLVFEHEPFDLGLVASEAADIVRMQAEARGITLHIQVDPGTRVIGDRQRTTQILINLLSNAVKFNRECGSVEMDAVCLDDRCRVTVCDTGFGIELERLDVLFEPFERLGADQRRIEGTGLGLTLSRKYAEAMGGSLTLAYTGPEGSAFCLELPSGQRAYADSH